MLTPAYARHGIALDEPRNMTPEAIRRVPSTWARRLSHGRERPPFVEFEGAVAAR